MTKDLNGYLFWKNTQVVQILTWESSTGNLVGNFLRAKVLKFPKLPILVKKKKRKKNIFRCVLCTRTMEAGMNGNEKEWKKN